MNGVLIFLACLPSIILLIFIYKVDKYNREPIKLLIGLFFLGILSVIPAIILEQILSSINFLGGMIGLIIEAFLVIALTEEYFKRLAVKLAAYRSKEYDERLDGIVYCVVASLGFATVENILYVIQFTDSNPYIWLMRAILSVPAHMLFGITMGYFLSLAKFCTNEKASKRYHRLSLWLPVLFHGLYDFFALSGYSLFVVFLIALMVFLWIYNMRKLKVFQKESKIANNLVHSAED